jgi:hypothetical protein
MNGIPRAISRFDLDLTRGFEDCRDRVYARHIEGVICARQYQATLNALRAYFGVRIEGKARRAPANSQIRLHRETLAIIEKKATQLQRAVNSKESEVLGHVPQSLLEKSTVETSNLDIHIRPYCDRDGFMDPDSVEVIADFTVTVKYSKRCGVRV